jgi:DNA-binding transcriptional LysR family regulator
VELIKDNFALRLYARVARLGSFSAAARGMRAVAVAGFPHRRRARSRARRQAAFTHHAGRRAHGSGSEFLARIEPILARSTRPNSVVREGGELRGLLRMSMPTSFGVRDVIPRLAAFAAAASGPADRVSGSVTGGRTWLGMPWTWQSASGDFPIPRRPARRIATIPASSWPRPTISRAAERPRSPDDLVGHRIVGGSAAAVPNAWRFEREGQEAAIKLEPYFFTDENEGAIAAAVAGFGITSTSGWACRRELEEGTLVRLLPGWNLPGIPVHAWFPMGRATRAAARAAVDHLVSAFERTPSVVPD